MTRAVFLSFFLGLVGGFVHVLFPAIKLMYGLQENAAAAAAALCLVMHHVGRRKQGQPTVNKLTLHKL